MCMMLPPYPPKEGVKGCGYCFYLFVSLILRLLCYSPRFSPPLKGFGEALFSS